MQTYVIYQLISTNLFAVGQVSKSITKNDVAQNMAHQNEKPLLQKEGSFVLQKEDSFVRTGSGRKLPKIPHRSLSANSGMKSNKLLQMIV